MTPTLKAFMVLALAFMGVTTTTIMGCLGVLDPQSVAALLAGATTGPLGFILGMNGQANAVRAATEAAASAAHRTAVDTAERFTGTSGRGPGG